MECASGQCLHLEVRKLSRQQLFAEEVTAPKVKAVCAAIEDRTFSVVDEKQAGRCCVLVENNVWWGGDEGAHPLEHIDQHRLAPTCRLRNLDEERRLEQ
eukprot:760937-Prymnesium_polylepis.1